MIVRGALAAVVALGLLAAPMATVAQPAGRVPRVGYLAGALSGGPQGLGEVFRQGLRELGWVDGQNIVIEHRYAEGRYDRLPDLAADLVRLKVDVIVVVGTAAAVAAKKATGTIPIVMTMVGEPVELGLITSLARPGGNVTGLTFSASADTWGKRLELLKEAVPKVRRLAVLSNPAHPAAPRVVKDVKATARSLGVQLQLLEARGPTEFDGAFAAMARERAGALLVLSEAMFFLHRTRLAELAAKNKLPSMWGQREFVEAGGLMSYGPSPDAMSRRAAFFVDRILNGAQPANLPVEQPSTFELVINTKTAKTLGLKMPPSLLRLADGLIE
jgi:putative ABC transport system substrate-binding protein